MSQRIRIHALVEGRVQGVGFRYFVMENALRLGLVGWVCNRWEGTVEVVAEGPEGEMDKLVAALHKGPSSAFVSQVKLQRLPATGEFSAFRVERTR